MERIKIGSEYFRTGYGRTKARKACIYLINGYAYAKDKATAKNQFHVLDGELSEYVMVNGYKYGESSIFKQCSNHSEIDKHLPYNLK